MSRDRRAVVAVAASVVVAAGVCLVILIAGVRDVPSWPTLDESPVGDVPGSLAGIRYDDRDDAGPGEACAVVIPLSDGDEREVTCGPFIGALGWSPDGELVTVSFADQQELRFYDPATAELVRTETRDPRDDLVAPEIPGMHGIRASDQARVVARSKDGRAVIEVTSDDGTESVLDVRGPRDYAIWNAWWSPDGDWILAQDSESRILLLRAGGDHAVRVVAEDLDYVAWFDPAHPPTLS